MTRTRRRKMFWRLRGARGEWIKTGILFLLTSLVLGMFSRFAASRGVFDVKEVRIVGVRYSDPVEILNVATPELGSDLFGDHHRAAVTLQKLPLIKKANVDKIPPNGIVIHLDEREPIAVLCGDTVVPIDEEGWLLPISMLDHHLDLPIINPGEIITVDAVGRVGSGKVHAALDFLRRLRELHFPLLQELSVLTVDESGVIRFTTVSRNFKVLLESDVTAKKLRLLMEVMRDLEREKKECCVIDMRYRDQVVVY